MIFSPLSQKHPEENFLQRDSQDFSKPREENLLLSREDSYHESTPKPMVLTEEDHRHNESFDMNAFKMVVLVAHRTKEIEAGMPLYVQQDPQKKDMLLALEEVETKALNLKNLEDRVISSYQQFSFLSKNTF